MKRYKFRYFALVDGHAIIEEERMTVKAAKCWLFIEQAIEQHTRPGDTISATVIKLEGPGMGEFDRVYNNVNGKAVRAR